MQRYWNVELGTTFCRYVQRALKEICQECSVLVRQNTMSESYEETEAGDYFSSLITADIYGEDDFNIANFRPVITDDEGEGPSEDDPHLTVDQVTTAECININNDKQFPQSVATGSNNGTTIPPMLEKEFGSEEEVEICFREYARTKGFGIRKHNKRRNVQGKITHIAWVCSREGFRYRKHLENKRRIREARPMTRTVCRAQFRINFNEQTRRWTCSYFQGNHNHELTPPKLVHHIQSHRRVTEPDLVAASSLQQVGVKPPQIHKFMVHRSGGYDKVGYSMKDVQNMLDSKR